ncbi:MAG: radical SAM/SPASM domain-containing protein [Imperialibacter sp.]|uniref:radical SAM/SPASM domain-containing protein n=1 Tax=Imperialibacter sp. TaxID=2038411 RepID=UPI0032ED77FA
MNLATFNDNVRLLNKLSWRKAVNGGKLLGSFLVSKQLGKARHSGLPISLAIEPTTACNLRCPECPSGLRSFSRPTGKIALPFFQKIIDEAQGHLLYLTFYFQGEPYLHPDFLEMVSYAHRKKIYTATSTNAHFLSDEMARKTIESGLDRLIISIDGATQDTYAAYRKEGKLQEVIDGTKRLVKWKKELASKTPHLIFQFLVVKPNEHEIEEIKRLGKELGVDEVRFKTAQIYDYENGSPLIPTISKYSRYSQHADGKWSLKNVLRNECWKMWHSGVVTWDGQMVPCCFDKDATHSMGNVSENSMAEIWRGASYNRFRNALLRSRKDIDICKNCSEGGAVWA